MMVEVGENRGVGMAQTIPNHDAVVVGGDHDMTTPVSDSTPTSVYRYYDVRGYLIYVGITKTGVSRNRQHNSDKVWWQWVDYQRVEHFASRDVAHAREVALIAEFQPPFNVQHNPEHAQLRQLYVALRESGEYATDPWGGGMIPPEESRVHFRVVEVDSYRVARAVSLLRDCRSAARVTRAATGSLVRQIDTGHNIGTVHSVELDGPLLIARVGLRVDWWLNTFYARLHPTGEKGKPIPYGFKAFVADDAVKVRRIA